MRRFTAENIEAKIRERIIARFGKDHPIKLAIFRPTPITMVGCQNPEYHPEVILIDFMFDEIIAHIPVWDLVPTENDMTEYETIDITNLTIKF